VTAGLDLIVLGVTLILAILLMPKGLVGALRSGFDLIQRKIARRPIASKEESEQPNEA
jgi:hypothetical protein